MIKKMGNRGLIKGVLLLFILGAVVYAGVSFAKPYYRYHTLGSHTNNFLKTDVGDINAIRKNIMHNAAALNVPLVEKNLDVKIVDKFVKVRATWTDTVDFWGYYQKKIDFVMEEEY